ncbi:major facilitator superfamily MFS_1 [Kribbella flavida DSM 17836]|uniref:Major facilitator superfamily MFS_1 n=1 Tax=Kribbella flavida (strain DSM 17836 / JCM 10339 / NBRC 14399) TaxID=479435 RepID=D2PX56_KRIFD|nr:MFS transporter [Kribbella flavida]ADB35436.1 major facilitator superfamily MFS_1 [Kribbella flavida DSM 17836]
MKQPLHGSLWSRPDVRLVLPARALSYAGDAVALVALTLRVSADSGPSSFAMTGLLLAFALPTVLMVPFAGRIVDSLDSRTVLVSASLLQAAAGAGLALADGLAATLALVCVLQVGQAVAGPAWAALIPRIVGEELIGRATGASQALTGVATIAGAGMGGLLVAWQGDTGALLVNAATFLGLAVVAWLVRTRRRPDPGGPAYAGGALAGVRSLLGDQLLRVLVPGLWLFILAAEALNVVEVYLLTGDLGLGPVGYGLIGAGQGVGAVAGAWCTGRLGADRARALAVVAGTALIGAAALLMGLTQILVLVALGAVGMGFAAGVLNTGTSTLVVTRTPEALRGRVIAALAGSTRACSLVALLLGGAAGALLGPRGTFLASGAACVLLAVVMVVPVLSALRREPGAARNDSVSKVVSH